MEGVVWLSLSWRARVNVEALNMAESVGYYVKHRRAPIAVYDKSEGHFVIRYVPTISGESVGHGYQVWLANEARREGLNVCKLCRRGELVKHGARVTLTDEGIVDDPKEIANPEKAHYLEKELIKRCVVEDVGGFLVPTRVPVKRTSRFYVGYMLPALEDLQATTLEPQFHVRHAPSLVGREREMPESGQAMYYVETGTAIYTESFALDLSGIGFTSMVEVEEAVEKNERIKRAICAVKALYPLLSGMFGAKRTRFDPDYELLSAVATLSVGYPFNVTSGHRRAYVAETMRRADKAKELFGGEFKVLTYIAEEGVDSPEGVVMKESLEELISELVNEAERVLKEV